MKKVLLVIMASCSVCLSALALAGYADDRAEIENVSNRYMVAVDAGDIETVMSTWADGGVLDATHPVEHTAVRPGGHDGLDISCIYRHHIPVRQVLDLGPIIGVARQGERRKADRTGRHDYKQDFLHMSPL